MTAAAEAKAPVRGWRVLGLAVFAQIGFSATEQGIPALTGFLKTDLGISATLAGLIVSSFTIGKIAGSYLAGMAADHLGELRVLLAGGFTTGGLIAAAVASPVWLFCILLAGAGAASATATPAGGRLVLQSFPRDRHGLALGIRQTGVPIGGLVGTALLPWVAHLAGWRWALLTGGALTAVFVLPLLFRRDALPQPAPRTARPRAPSPGRDRNVRLLIVWACLVISGQYALMAFLALDFSTGAGMSLAAASLFVALTQAAGIAGRVFWGALSDRAVFPGRKPVLLIVTGVSLVSALLLLATPRTAPVAVLAGVAALAGVALVGYQGLWITMVAEAAGPERVGATTGYAIMFVGGAIAVTPPLYGLVADLAGYRAIWGVLAAVLALSFIPASLLGESTSRAGS